MAITKSSKIESILIRYPIEGDAVVEVNSTVSWDDPDDNELPVSRPTSKLIQKMTTSTSYDEETGTPIHTQTLTDYSGEDASVVAICDLVWAD